MADNICHILKLGLIKSARSAYVAHLTAPRLPTGLFVDIPSHVGFEARSIGFGGENVGTTFFFLYFSFSGRHCMELYLKDKKGHYEYPCIRITALGHAKRRNHILWRNRQEHVILLHVARCSDTGVRISVGRIQP